MRKVHCVRSATLRPRAQVGRVTKHHRQRNNGFDDLRAGARFHSLDATAPRVQVADNVTHIFFRQHDLDLHDRLEQGRTRLLAPVLERHRTSNLECYFRRVHLVVRTVVKGDLHVLHFVARKNTGPHRLFNALLNRLDVFLRNGAPDDVVFENETGAHSTRFDGDFHVAILPATTGLSDVFALRVRLLPNRFLVGDLRLADVGTHVEFPHHAVDDDFQVKFTHSRNDGLVRIRVRVDLERRIFLRQLPQSNAHLLLVGLGFRLDGDGDHRLREIHRLEQNLLLFVANGIARRDIAKANRGGNIAGHDILDLFTLVGVHLQKTPDALASLLGRVEDVRAGVQTSRINTEEGQLPDERVGHDLEDEAGERLLVIGLANLGLGVTRIHTFDRRNVEGGGQKIHHTVEQLLYALVLERGSADHRRQLDLNRRLADSIHQLFIRNRIAADVLFHQVLVDFRSGLDELFAIFVDDILIFGGNFFDAELGAHRGVVEHNGFVLNQVNDTAERVFLAQRILNGDRLGVKATPHHVEDTTEIGAGPIHLVDESNARHTVFVSLPPYGF